MLLWARLVFVVVFHQQPAWYVRDLTDLEGTGLRYVNLKVSCMNHTGNAWEVRESAQLFQSTRLRPQTVTGMLYFLALRMVAPVPERGLR